MPLKIRVKPEGQVSIGGTLVKNGGKRPCDLVILGDVPVLREEYIGKNLKRQPTALELGVFINAFNFLDKFEASQRYARGYGAFPTNTALPIPEVISVMQWLQTLTGTPDNKSS